MKTTLARFALPALALAALSCDTGVPDTDRRDRDMSGVSTLGVTITNGDPGTAGNPRPYAAMGVSYTVEIEVRGSDGARLPDFDGWVVVAVNPGQILRVDGANGTEVQGRNVHLVNGVGSATLTFQRAYGETRITAEEDGYVPTDIARDPPPACANGVDDDGDGNVDYPADFGCAAPNDDSEAGGSFASAASGPMYFASPRIYDVQGASSMSPLENERISVTAGTLVVTRLSVSGFWATDISEPHTCPDPLDSTIQRPCYNSIFAFNFSLPAGMRACDQLLLLQGTVSEFASTTQLDQPAWTLDPNHLYVDTGDPNGVPCPIPDAIEIGAVTLGHDNLLEPYESSLVFAQGLRFSTLVGPDHPVCTGAVRGGTCDFMPGRSNCDYTNDGKIDFTNDDEARCSNACQVTAGCSEWSNWIRFGQVSVDFATGQMDGVQRLVIAPKTAIPDFDPQHPPVTDPNMNVTVTGTLKQVGPNWIIEPRCTQDMVFGNDVRVPPNASCVTPRPPPEDN